MDKRSKVQQHDIFHNQDVITQIFSSLSFGEVLLVKTVCRSWEDFANESKSKYVVDDESKGKYGFVGIAGDSTEESKYHLSHIEYDYHRGTIKKNKLMHPEFSFFNFQPILVGSRNGLVCVALPFCSKDSYEYCAEAKSTCDPIYLCNPITKEYTLLPRYRNGEYLNGGCMNFGFAFHEEKFKVVRIFWDDSDVGDAQMFILGTGNWVSLENTASFLPSSSHRGVYADGALYWVSYNSEKVISLDLTSNQFCEVVSPPFAIDVDSVQPLDLNNKFCLLHEGLLDEDNGSEITVWMLENMVWKKLFKFASKDSQGNLLDLSSYVVDGDREIFGLIKNHEILYWHDNTLLNYYDINTEAEATLFEDKKFDNLSFLPHAHSFFSLRTVQPENTLNFREPVELKMESPPATVLNKPFMVRLTITNHLNKHMGPFKIFLSRQDEEEVVISVGAKYQEIQQVEAFSSMNFCLRLMATSVGVQKIRGITLLDLDQGDNKVIPDVEILVNSNSSG